MGIPLERNTQDDRQLPAGEHLVRVVDFTAHSLSTTTAEERSYFYLLKDVENRYEAIRFWINKPDNSRYSTLNKFRRHCLGRELTPEELADWEPDEILLSVLRVGVEINENGFPRVTITAVATQEEREQYAMDLDDDEAEEDLDDDEAEDDTPAENVGEDEAITVDNEPPTNFDGLEGPAV